MERARAETKRYHSELYSNHELFQPGTWLQSNSFVEVTETRNGAEYTLRSRTARIIAQRIS